LQSPQARKSGENCYSFFIPLWFALKQSFFVKNHTTRDFAFVGDNPFAYMKKTKKFLWCQIDFLDIFNFFVLTIFWLGAKQRFCFRESMSVLDQNGRIQALGFLSRWRLTSHALYYKIPYHSTKKRCMKNLIFHLIPALFFLQSHGHAQLGQHLTEVAFASSSTYLK